MRVAVVLVAVVAALATPPVFARTWHVERDGSGDFTSIQPAADAAAAGDTIRIGPGRFDEWHYPPEYPISATHVHVTKSLTFIGSGTDQTIIGPADLFEFSWDDYVYGFANYESDPIVSLCIANLTVENIMRNGVYLRHGRIEMFSCEVRHCVGFGVRAFASLGGVITDCEFQDNGYWGERTGDAISLHQPSIGVAIEDCSIRNTFGTGIQVNWQGCDDIVIRDCTIDNGKNGIVVAEGASASIYNCAVSNQSIRGIYLLNSGDIVLEDCTIDADTDDPDHSGVSVSYAIGSLSMHNNVVASSDLVLWFEAEVGVGDVSGNHFLRTTDTAWWVKMGTNWPLPEPRIIYLENNYWGTTDTELLDEWIYDGNDNENVNVFIDYLPLADGPVQTESVTWGAVKSRFLK